MRPGLIPLLLAAARSSEAVPITMDSSILTDDQGRVPNLVCPGARGCLDGGGPLFAGAARRAITPSVEGFADPHGNNRPDGDFDDHDGNGIWDPVWLAGFADVGRPPPPR